MDRYHGNPKTVSQCPLVISKADISSRPVPYLLHLIRISSHHWAQVKKNEFLVATVKAVRGFARA